MSSATSTEAASFRPWHFFVVVALAAATVAVMLSRRTTPEHLILLSLTIFAAGAASVAIYLTVLPIFGGDRMLRGRPLGERSRAALEAEKLLALRAIKELEFDRAMGKVSDEDFADMSQRLRARAMRVLQQLDDTGAAQRDRIERELADRLGPRRDAGGASEELRECPACGTGNDRDARFCKQCGGKIQ
jgi:hypothetical protein